MTVCHVSSGSCQFGGGLSPPLSSDNHGKSASDAVCSLKHFFTASPLAVSLPLSSLTAPAYERSEGERVVYEPGGDHLGWPTSSCPIFHSPFVQLSNKCQVPFYCSSWLNLALVSQTVIAPALQRGIFVWERSVPGMLSVAFFSGGCRQQLSKRHPADRQVTGRLSEAPCHFTAHTSAKRKAPYLSCPSRSTYRAASLSVMTLASPCDLLWVNTNLPCV